MPAGKEANSQPIFNADRTKLNLEDVIAVQGPGRGTSIIGKGISTQGPWSLSSTGKGQAAIWSTEPAAFAPNGSTTGRQLPDAVHP